MARGNNKMAEPIRAKIAELDRQIDDLQRRISEAMATRKAFQEVLATITGTEAPKAERKARVQNVKETVLDIMARAGSAGHTSAEVFAAAREVAQGVGKDTISSVLSRLKSMGALHYDGLRYFDIKYAPKDGDQRPFQPHIKVV